ncbi:hypothetical protein [Caballeronia sp. 15715]|jgi:hypothetical protein|uniref:hypothetical protein n=1 Tax=unclassified Caballeronia TaxID=2646786 RepID=UPI0039E55763
MDAFTCRKIGHIIQVPPHHLFQIGTLSVTGNHQLMMVAFLSQSAETASREMASMVDSLQRTTHIPLTN